MSLTQKQIGERVGLSQAHVSDIVCGVVWKELNDGGPSPRERRIQLVKERDDRARFDIQEGKMSYKEIAVKYGIALSVVTGRLLGRDYKHRNAQRVTK